jgi:AcrR family transcriptional regulator
MSSQKANQTMREPSRKRGHERVAALLSAAASCFVEKGYDAVTLTEIAARAGASIGSLYQFFPTRDALVNALLTDYAEALYARLARLAADAQAWDTDQMAAQLIGFLPLFRRRYPAFAVLAESASLPASYGIAIRKRLRTELQALLQQKSPEAPAARLRAATVVVQQLMKAALAVNEEPGLTDRKSALAELEHALRLYLRSVLSSPVNTHGNHLDAQPSKR